MDRATAPGRGGRFSWRGPGLTAFAGSSRPAREEPGEAPVETEAPLAIDRAARAAAAHSLTARSPELAAAVDGFFQAGGDRCLALPMDPGGRGRPHDPPRSRLAALAEREDVGTIAVLGAEAGLRDWLLELAGKRPDLFVVLEGASTPAGRAEAADRRTAASGEEGAGRFMLHRLRENVAVVNGPPGPGGEERTGAVGRLLGYLEAATFRDEERFLSTRPAPPAWLGGGDRAALEEWRFREGLRRSVDWGTRWAVFAIHQPLVWRALEREVAAFLAGLARRRLLIPDAEGRAFEVACSPAPRAGQPGGEERGEAGSRRKAAPRAAPAPRIEVRVWARWRGAAAARPGGV